MFQTLKILLTMPVNEFRDQGNQAGGILGSIAREATQAQERIATLFGNGKSFQVPAGMQEFGRPGTFTNATNAAAIYANTVDGTTVRIARMLAAAATLPNAFEQGTTYELIAANATKNYGLAIGATVEQKQRLAEVSTELLRQMPAEANSIRTLYDSLGLLSVNIGKNIDGWNFFSSIRGPGRYMQLLYGLRQTFMGFTAPSLAIMQAVKGLIVPALTMMATHFATLPGKDAEKISGFLKHLARDSESFGQSSRTWTRLIIDSIVDGPFKAAAISVDILAGGMMELVDRSPALAIGMWGVTKAAYGLFQGIRQGTVRLPTFAQAMAATLERARAFGQGLKQSAGQGAGALKGLSWSGVGQGLTRAMKDAWTRIKALDWLAVGKAVQNELVAGVGLLQHGGKLALKALKEIVAGAAVTAVGVATVGVKIGAAAAKWTLLAAGRTVLGGLKAAAGGASFAVGGALTNAVGKLVGMLARGAAAALNFINPFHALPSVAGKVAGAFGSIGAAFTSSHLGELVGAHLIVDGIRGIAGGLMSVAGSAVETAAAMEQNQVAFGVMLGGAEKAKAVLADLSTFAAATPFEMPGLVDATKELAAAQVAQSQLIPTMKVLGDISAATNKPIGEMAGIYAKIKSTGKADMERLNQIAEAGVPIFSELQKQLGVNQAKLNDMVEHGKIGLPEIQKVFKKITSAGGQFEDMAAKQSQTLAGLWSSLKDNLGQTAGAIAAGLLEAFDAKRVMGLLVGLSDWVRTTAVPSIVAGIGFLRSLVTPVIDGVVGFVTANLSLIGSVGLSMLTALGQAWSFVWGGIMSVVSAVGGWFMGFMSSTFGATIRTFADLLQTALIVGEFAWTRWREVLWLAVLAAGYGVVRFANQVMHFFGVAIPAYLVWFGRNWWDILQTSLNFLSSFCTNAAKNIYNLFAAIGTFFKTGQWNFAWTPLTEGFKNTIRELPKIAQREIGPLEKSLGDAMGRSQATLAADFDKFKAERLQKLADDQKKQQEAVPPATPKIDELTIDAAAAGGKEKKVPKKKSETKALEAGSADAFSAINAFFRGDTRKSPHEQKVEAQNDTQNGLLRKIADNGNKPLKAVAL